MKAAVIERYGTPDVLEIRDVPAPTPRPDDVLVRVRAASINDWDWGMLTGTPRLYRLISGIVRPKHRIIGCDVAGTVEAVGENVRSLAVGDDVYGDMCECGFGAFAEYVSAPATSLARKPAGMSFEQAAAIPQAGMLAWQGLVDAGRIQSGQRVLLNGAGGGVGTLGLQIARLHDVEVTAIDKASKLDMLRALGADQVFDYTTHDFTRSDRRYDLILDVRTNRSPFACARALTPGGAYITVGGDVSRLLQTFALGPVISRLHGKRVSVHPLSPNKDLAEMNTLFEAGTLRPVIDGPYAFSELRDALRLFGRADHKGKIVVTLD